MDFHSVLAYFQTFSFDRAIVLIMSLCLIAGGIDSFLGNRWGIGEKFMDGLKAFPTLALNMVGIILLVPMLSDLLSSTLAPLMSSLGADSAMLAGMFIANDCGGYQLASQLSDDPNAVSFGGMMLGSMMGATVIFNIPVSLGMVPKKHHEDMIKGILCGLITLPIGAFLGGLTCSYAPLWMAINLIPVSFLSVLLTLGLIFFPKILAKVMMFMGRLILAAAFFSTVYGMFSEVTGIRVVKNYGSVPDAFMTVITVVMVLPGAYVLVELLSRLLEKPISKLTGLLGINRSSAVGILATATNTIATFHMVKDMDRRGIVLNFSFVVSASFLLGDHLAFCTAVEPSFAVPMLVGKLTGGILALILAFFITKKPKEVSI